MGLEIERKFLVKNRNWRTEADQGTVIRQGYLNSDKERTVRVRVYGEQGFLTIKGKSNQLTRQEFEYEVPLEEAQQMLRLCEKPLIEKTRFLLKHEAHTWEIDVFEGENEGLIVAEVELESESDSVTLLDWVGAEVSDDQRYFNSSLIRHPFKAW